MTALSDALATAQARAVAALAKQYVAGVMDRDAVTLALIAAGLSDPVDTEAWFACLDTIREAGATLPGEAKAANGKPDDEKASDRQLAFIAKLVKEKGLTGPDLPLTKEQAHEVINAIQAGSYDAAKWAVPF